MPKVAIEVDSEEQWEIAEQIDRLITGLGFETKWLSSADMLAGGLDSCDAVTFPGTLASLYGLRTYGDKLARCIQYYVASGMGYLGVCGGAYIAGVSLPLAFTLYARTTLGLIDCQMGQTLWTYINQYRDLQEEKLLCTFNISHQTHPIIAGHEGEQVEISYSGGPVIRNCGPSVRRLMSFYDEAMADFAGETALAVSQFGKGRVVVISPHAEAPRELHVEIGEPSLRWLYESMIRYVVEPEPEAYFPVPPWEKAAPMPTPILPMLGIAGICGVILGGRAKK